MKEFQRINRKIRSMSDKEADMETLKNNILLLNKDAELVR